MRLRGRFWLLPNGRGRVLSAVCAGLIAAGALGDVVVERVTALPEGSVLRVGDVTVSQEDFQQRLDMLGALYGAKEPTDGAKRDRFRRDAAHAVATSVVLDKVAVERRVAVSDRDARNALDKIIRGKFPQGRQQFSQALSSLRVSERAVLTEIKRQLSSSRVFESVTKDADPVNDAELRRAYDKRKESLAEPEKRRLSNIVLDSSEKAHEVFEKARAGADFTELAAQSSLDKTTSDKGGDLGFVSAEQLERPVAKAAFAAPAGELFGPVRGRYGWNVGRVAEIRPAKQPTFDQTKEQLRMQLSGEHKLAVWRPWLSERIRAADVEYADGYRPADPDAIPPGAAQ